MIYPLGYLAIGFLLAGWSWKDIQKEKEAGALMWMFFLFWPPLILIDLGVKARKKLCPDTHASEGVKK